MSPTPRHHCAFLTLADAGSHCIDDDLAIAPLEQRGIRVDTLAWDSPQVDWDRYDLVVIRSTWDYHKRPQEFLATLAELDRSRARLENNLGLVRDNVDKSYLRRLEQAGVPSVPTLWRDHLQAGELARLFEQHASGSMIVKPLVGAGAEGAWHVTADNLAAVAGEVEAHYRARPLLVQSFVPAIVEEGEHSLIFFNGEFSHGLLKCPRAGDFRSQEEFGSELRAIVPPAGLLAAGKRVMACLPDVPLYARVDLVRSPDPATFWLMELELVEPGLYLRMDAEAPERFASAIAARLGLEH